MSATTTAGDAVPLVPALRTDPDGTPYLVGSRCDRCGASFVGERTVCAQCCARDTMSAFRLADKGRVYSFTVVHRSYPGVPVPFVDVTVELCP